MREAESLGFNSGINKMAACKFKSKMTMWSWHQSASGEESRTPTSSLEPYHPNMS